MPLVTIETAEIVGIPNNQVAKATGFEMDVNPANVISVAEIYDNPTSKTPIAYNVRFVGDKMPIPMTLESGESIKDAFE